MAGGDDSRGETSEESHGEGSSSAESETAEPEATTRELAQVLGIHDTGNVAPAGAKGGGVGPGQASNAPLGKGKAGGPVGRTAWEKPAQKTGSTARDPVSLGRVLEETAREHLSSFSREEMEVWNWHRGNLEISCGAVSVTGEQSLLTVIQFLTARRRRVTEEQSTVKVSVDQLFLLGVSSGASLRWCLFRALVAASFV